MYIYIYYIYICIYIYILPHNCHIPISISTSKISPQWLQASTIAEFAARLWPVLSKLTEGAMAGAQGDLVILKGEMAMGVPQKWIVYKENLIWKWKNG